MHVGSSNSNSIDLVIADDFIGLTHENIVYCNCDKTLKLICLGKCARLPL